MSKDPSNKKARPGNKRPVKASKTEQAVEAVQVRNEFYRDGYRKAWNIAFGAIIAAVIAIVIAGFSLTKETEYRYFALKPNGTLLEMVSLDEPNHNESVVSQWFADALRETFTFSFADFQMRLNKAFSSYYTQSGRKAIDSALQNQGILPAIIDRDLFLSITLSETPVIQRSGTVSGSYVWEITVPATLTYRNSKGSPFTQKVNIKGWVVRQSELDNPSGLGIEMLQMVSVD